MLKFENLKPYECIAIVDQLTDLIRQQVYLQEKKGVLIGLSGGIDSALTIALAAKAIGPENIMAIILPDKDSNAETVDDARLIADHVGVKNVYIKDISPNLETLGSYDLFKELYAIPRESREQFINKERQSLAGTESPTGFIVNYRKNGNELLRKVRALWNSKIRMRMVILYFHAELHNLLVLGTTNLSEYNLGWFTKYGDGAVDVEVLLSLYKTRVYELAKYLQLPEKIISKKPTGDILPGFEDELSFGLSYEMLDKIFLGFEKGYSDNDIAQDLNISDEIAKNVRYLIDSSKYSKMPPISCLSPNYPK